MTRALGEAPSSARLTRSREVSRPRWREPANGNQHGVVRQSELLVTTRRPRSCPGFITCMSSETQLPFNCRGIDLDHVQNMLDSANFNRESKMLFRRILEECDDGE